MRGYKAIGEWADDLSPRVLQRFRVRRRDGVYRPPSLSAMRNLLIRVDPAQLDAALRAWHEAHGSGDSALAIDGKTIRGAIDDEGCRAHVLGVVGHDTGAPWGQKSRHEAGCRRRREAYQRDRHQPSPCSRPCPTSRAAPSTADALLTQRTLATYLIGRGADYLFTVKGNQKTLLSDIRLTLDEDTPAARRTLRTRAEARARPPREALHLGLGRAQRLSRLPRRRSELRRAPRNRRGHVRQTPVRDRLRRHQPAPDAASPERLLALNRGHWTIEATHHILDWSFDEDRSRIRAGHGPENMTPLRRFAIGVVKGRGLAVAETMRNLARNPRRVLDFLKMTDNTAPRPAPG